MGKGYFTINIYFFCFSVKPISTNFDRIKLTLVQRTFRLFLIVLPLFATFSSLAQKKQAYVSGKVVDENENPLGNVSVMILGRQKGVATSDSGAFRLQVPADRAFAIVFTFTGY